MPEFEILPVSSGRMRRAFLELPYQLYDRDPFWVAPLRRDQKRILDQRRHPFYRHAESQLFVARRGSEMVGRIAAILDGNALPEAGRRLGWFGFFESSDDRAVVAGLVDAARAWLQARGAQLMRGPVNPSYNYGAGVLVEGFADSPALGTSYNPPYYDNLLLGAGLGKAQDFLAFRLTPEQLREAQTLAARFALAPAGARIRPFDVRHMEREARHIHDLHSRGFTRNYDFVPLSVEEVREIAADIKRYGDERFVQFCEVDGRMAGVVVALPDWNQALQSARGRLFPWGWWRVLRGRRHIDRLRIWLLTIAPEWQGTGLAAAFLSLVDQPGSARYTGIEVSWIVESHQVMLRALSLLRAKASKRYRMYEAVVD
jgi:hypothetical protein